MTPRERVSRAVPSGVSRGIIGTLRAGLAAGALAGLLAGLADGVRAVATVPIHVGAGSALLCVAATVLQYAALGGIGLALLGMLLHPWLVRREFELRYRWLLGIGLGVAIFAPLYWLTRSAVFPGYSALSWQRSSAAVAMLAAGLALGALVARVLTSFPRSVQRVLSLALGLCVVAGGIFLGSQGDLARGRGALNERNGDLPNVLLIVVDAMRQDVLGCYGNERVKTPNIDRLAREGVVFENAFVQAPFTWTSFGSLLTGKYPRRHGLMRMKPGVEMVEQVTLPWHLKHALRTDGRALEPDDYLTASFHTGTLQEKSKLLRGFDLVFEETAGHDLFDVEGAWSRVSSELLLWTFQNRVRKRFDSGLVASEARNFLGGMRDRRFMAMVHLYSTHTPYDPPREFAQMYRDPAYAGPIHSFYEAHRKAIESGKYSATPEDVQQIRNLYYGGVSQADALIGSLVATLERNGMRENTLVIVTADHGESLGEDGLWEHNHLVRRELCVPLILWSPSRLPAGKRVAALVDEIDVLPTVCEFAGLRPPSGTDVRELVDGRSLLPLVRGETSTLRPYSFAETGGRVSILDLEHALSVPRRLLAPESIEEVERLVEAERRDPKHRPRLVAAQRNAEHEPDVFEPERAVATRLLLALHSWSRSMPIPVSNVDESARDHESDVIRDAGYGGGIDDDEPATHVKPVQGGQQ